MPEKEEKEKLFNKQFWSAAIVFAILMRLAGHNLEEVFIFTLGFMMALILIWSYL